MKFQRFFTFLFALAILVPFTSCDKDKDENTVELTKTDLLTTSDWQGVAMFSDGVDVTQQPQYDFTKQIWKYEKDGKYMSSYERKALTGTWEFVENQESILHDKGAQDEMVTRITKLTATELVIEYVTARGKLIEERYVLAKAGN